MVSVVVCLVLGLVLVAAAALKLAGGARARGRRSRPTDPGPRAAYAVWARLIAVELVLGVAVAAGIDARRDRRARC